MKRVRRAGASPDVCGLPVGPCTLRHQKNDSIFKNALIRNIWQNMQWPLLQCPQTIHNKYEAS